MPLYPYNEVRPRLGERVFVAPGAIVTGDLEAGDDCSFWFQTVARGDVHRIRIGARTNVQDGAVLHVTHETHPLAIGERVVIGHGADAVRETFFHEIFHFNDHGHGALNRLFGWLGQKNQRAAPFVFKFFHGLCQ